jgi:hypothetical protein
MDALPVSGILFCTFDIELSLIQIEADKYLN